MSEHAPEGGMTFDQAKSAIEQAGQQEAADEAANMEQMFGSGDTAPDQAAAPTPGEEQRPDDFSTPDVEDSFVGGDFNPDLLPDELLPGWKQLQGSYTKKTQELAAQRKAYEGLGDPDELRQAAEFYQSLRDPEYLKNFYEELGSVVQEMGLVEAPAAPEEQAPPVPAVAPELAAIASSDPELAPFVEQFASMRSELDEFKAQAAREREALAEERQMMDDAYEIDRQVQAVRELHPDWDDDDMQVVYDRAVALDGDVTRAAELQAEYNDRIIQSYLSRKQQAPAPPIPGGGSVAASQPEDESELSYKERLARADAAADAWLAANDAAEFTG